MAATDFRQPLDKHLVGAVLADHKILLTPLKIYNSHMCFFNIRCERNVVSDIWLMLTAQIEAIQVKVSMCD